MPRHQPERLHVHDEPGRRPLRPALDGRLDRQAVVRRVDLDGVEVLRVPREPLARRQLRRIEVLREGVVGPGAGPDADVRRYRETARVSTDSRSVSRPIAIDEPAGTFTP